MQPSATRTLSTRLRDFLHENWLYFVVLLALFVFPYIVGWITGSDPTPQRARDAGESTFWQGVFVQVFALAILSISYNLMFGFTGVISFGHAMFFGMGAYGLGVSITKFNLPFGVAIIFALVISGLLGLIVGLVSLRIKGVYFAIFTLAFAQVFFVLAKNRLLVDITGAEDGFFFTVPVWLNPIPKNRLVYYYISLGLLAISFALVRRLVNSPTGRVFQAIRENEERARAIGYNTLVFKLISIVIAGMLASLAGMIHVILNNKQPLPDLLGAAYTIEPLLATLLGGIGTFSGPALGAAILRLGEDALRGLTFTIGSTVIDVGDSWALALGISFIVIVMLFPQGVVGTWHKWRYSRRSQRIHSAGDKLEAQEITK